MSIFETIHINVNISASCSVPKYSLLIVFVFEYGIKQKAPTIVRLLMLINDIFLCLILEHQCCSSFECVRATAIAHP